MPSFVFSGPQLLGAHPDPVPHPDPLRQHPGHPVRVPRALAADSHELFYSLVGHRRSPGRRGRDAICCLFSGKLPLSYILYTYIGKPCLMASDFGWTSSLANACDGVPKSKWPSAKLPNISV